jgi:predicted amino acid-binding ACT domain protein
VLDWPERARYAVTAVGVDRPGVVAALSGALGEQRCNLEDSQMALLGGHATMMRVVDARHSVTAERLQGALTEGLGTWAWPYGSRPSSMLVLVSRPAAGRLVSVDAT